jgi:3-deoxy-7-phosphoheptulonate synthase
MVASYADVLQIGARNAQNVPLLAEVAASGKVILLKRGVSGLIDEWLLAAEYVCVHGNSKVILCERGIRTFETYTRFTVDINAVPAVKSLTHLPLMVDPSHGTGKPELIAPVARAAIAAGADALMIEVHPHPEKALKDGYQSLRPPAFVELMTGVRKIAEAMGRCL